MIFYHFTTQEPGESIRPYELDPTRPDLELLRAELLKCKGEPTGIWLWPNKPGDELLKHFLIWRIYNGTGDSGTLYECEVEPDNLLSWWMPNFLFRHTLSSEKLHFHSEPFDIAIYEITHFRPIARAEIMVEWLKD